MKGADEMAVGGNGGSWTDWLSPLATLITFIVGALAGLFIRGLQWASAEGRAEGALSTWRTAIEARISLIEAENHRAEEALKNVANRLEVKGDIESLRMEMNQDFDRLRNGQDEDRKSLAVQISELRGIILENRNMGVR